MLVKRGKIRFLLILYISFIIAVIFIRMHSLTEPFTIRTVYEVGQIAGVTGISLLAIQILLTSRIPFIEKGVGYDRLIRWHNTNAKIMLFFLLSHPVLLTWKYLSLTFAEILEIISAYTISHYLGISALILMIFIAVISIYRKLLRIPYHIWKKIHLITYVIAAFGFLHSFALAFQYRGLSAPITWWWIGLMIIIVISIINHYLLSSSRKFEYVVSSVRSIASNVTSLVLKPTSKRMSFQAGQFAYISLKDSFSKEEHPFTIASDPRDDTLEFVIKNNGDYTSQISRVKEGTTVMVEGPYGVLSNIQMPGPFVFVAGGIGITPLMSMLRHMKGKEDTPHTHLYYGNRTSDDIAFYDELVSLQESEPWFEVTFVLSHERKENMPHGRITADFITKDMQHLRLANYFIVGPPSMMKSIEKGLISKGVNKTQIFTEKFELS